MEIRGAKYVALLKRGTALPIALEKSYVINYRFVCDSKGVVYLLQCKNIWSSMFEAQSHHLGHV